jgi:uncharacterized protein DUF6527
VGLARVKAGRGALARAGAGENARSRHGARLRARPRDAVDRRVVEQAGEDQVSLSSSASAGRQCSGEYAVSDTLPTFTRGEWEDIGHGQRVRRVYRDGELDALDWDHKCTNPAEDFIPLGGNREHSWAVESADPLTISPSLLCTACRVHGFIRGGKWQPC